MTSRSCGPQYGLFHGAATLSTAIKGTRHSTKLHSASSVIRLSGVSLIIVTISVSLVMLCVIMLSHTHYNNCRHSIMTWSIPRQTLIITMIRTRHASLKVLAKVGTECIHKGFGESGSGFTESTVQWNSASLSDTSIRSQRAALKR
jgi:hypothetical protein